MSKVVKIMNKFQNNINKQFRDRILFIIRDINTWILLISDLWCERLWKLWTNFKTILTSFLFVLFKNLSSLLKTIFCIFKLFENYYLLKHYFVMINLFPLHTFGLWESLFIEIKRNIDWFFRTKRMDFLSTKIQSH